MQPLWMIELPVLMGNHPQQASSITNFVVVEAPSAYNVILRRPTLNQAKAVVLTYSLVVKFPTPQGVGILRGDQVTARSWYVTSRHRNAASKTLNVEEVDSRKEKEGVSPVEELTHVIIDPRRPDRFVHIASLHEPEHRVKLTQFFRQNQDVFCKKYRSKNITLEKVNMSFKEEKQESC